MSSKSSSSVLNSVTKKQIMGITGLLLCGFVLSHLLGNLLLFVSSDAFNKYSYALTSNPLIYLAEAGLGLLFVVHTIMAIKLVIENKAARPIAYHTRKHSGRGSTFASSTMPFTGIITLIFLILHLINLKFGSHYETEVHGVVMRDIYKTTVEYFQDPLHVLFYIVCVTSLGIHVSHGFWSAFQSLGLNHPKYLPKIKFAACAFGILVAVGFSALAVFCYFQGGR
ncbi:MAG: succinate dehydrogenase cytochrome b subunit [Bdellovibrionales bacterium]|nr:succinate dehydrogenase cytochrome b subunit [Bdellovibrionales bacterium]